MDSTQSTAADEFSDAVKTEQVSDYTKNTPTYRRGNIEMVQNVALILLDVNNCNSGNNTISPITIYYEHHLQVSKW
jgi:hypothetical protein